MISNKLKIFLLFQCTKSKAWKEIAAQLGIGASSSGAYTLKKHYGKNLLAFECQFDRGGIDPAPILAQVEAAQNKGKKAKAGANNATNQPPPAPSPGSQDSRDSTSFSSSSNQTNSEVSYPSGPGYGPGGPSGPPPPAGPPECCWDGKVDESESPKLSEVLRGSPAVPMTTSFPVDGDGCNDCCCGDILIIELIYYLYFNQ